MSESPEFYNEMDKLQQEVESDSVMILREKLGRLPTCKELSDYEESLLNKGEGTST